jgi:hypothetical protein
MFHIANLYFGRQSRIRTNAEDVILSRQNDTAFELPPSGIPASAARPLWLFFQSPPRA